MADIPDFDENVGIIAALSDLPNASDGLSAEELKAKFDVAAGLIKTFLNDTLIPQTANKTTAALTYYVRTDGSDSNDGLSNTSGGAFLTVGKAISVIPQVVNHTVIIHVAAGTYSEDVTIEGFVGKKDVVINGGGVATIRSLSIENCTIPVAIQSIQLNSSSAFDAACEINMCIWVSLYQVTIIVPSVRGGVHVTKSRAFITSSTFSNRGAGIECTDGADVFSSSNSGSGNTYGVKVEQATISLSFSQPSGTTANEYNDGGTIR